MAARSESPYPVYRWQCCGCKALYLSEKNVKLHVAFHVKGRAAAAAAGRPSHGILLTPRVRLRLGLACGSPGPQASKPPAAASHWPEAAANSGLKYYQRILLNPAARSAGGGARIIPDGPGPGPGPGACGGGGGPGRLAAAGAESESGSESDMPTESATAGYHDDPDLDLPVDWQDRDDEDSEQDAPEPGKECTSIL